MDMRSLVSFVVGFSAFVSLDAAAECGERKTIDFEVKAQTAYGESVYVLGNIKELGGNDVRHAVKLVPVSYPLWKLSVSVPADQTVQYRYFVRSDKAQDVGKSENGRPISDVISKQAESLRSVRNNEGQSGEYVRDYNPSNPPKIQSAILGGSRGYRVVLPPGYKNSSERYPVIYANDGQNIFESGSFGSWRGVEALNAEHLAGRLREVIVVGVDNSVARMSEYVPPEDGGTADAYARFIAEELKPFIDAEYRTLPEVENTAILGSSLGGLVSLYMLWDHNHVFGRAGVFSGSFMMKNFPQRLKDTSRPEGTRLYMDSGNAGVATDGFLNSRNVRDTLVSKSDPFTTEKDFRYVIGIGQQHNEAAWASRLPAALSFLFPKCEIL